MRILLAFAFLMAYAQAINITSIKEQHIIPSGEYIFRPLGDYLAEHGQFPWHALIIMDQKYFCSGSLIAPDVVLTTGLCLHGFEEFEVIFSAEDYFNKDNTERISFKTSSKTIHEHFDPKTLTHDVGFIILPEKVILNDYIQTIRLATYCMASDEFTGANSTLVGWADPLNSMKTLEQLTFAVMTVIPIHQCCHTYEDELETSHLCATAEPGDTACFGDLGSGLIVKDTHGRDTLIGIMSSYYPNCTPGKPAVFTRITSFLKWIETKAAIAIF